MCIVHLLKNDWKRSRDSPKNIQIELRCLSWPVHYFLLDSCRFFWAGVGKLFKVIELDCPMCEAKCVSIYSTQQSRKRFSSVHVKMRRRKFVESRKIRRGDEKKVGGEAREIIRKFDHVQEEMRKANDISVAWTSFQVWLIPNGYCWTWRWIVRYRKITRWRCFNYVSTFVSVML